MPKDDARHFLFLQGPHGPFFWSLGTMLRKAGVQVTRVGFNQGDSAFWPDKKSFIPFQDTPDNWQGFVEALYEDLAITDIVLYGDVRAIHAQAITLAKSRGITVHIFEEGYLRPFWVTYERGGSNGHSKLMDFTLPQMRKALGDHQEELPDAPALWGDMREHIFYGALYHFFVMFLNKRYKNFRPHRALQVHQEFGLYLKRLLTMPFTSLERAYSQRRIKRGGFPYQLVLMQLEHDSSFQKHSSFESMTEFLELVLRGFAADAPKHHHIVFKAHPLEDGRSPVLPLVKSLTKELGLKGRVHFVRGGKLGALLSDARAVLTVNSTAAQQALWCGLPTKIFGDAVYNKEEFISVQSLSDFFKRPMRPDHQAYKDYRTFLLETSQVAGGFYSAKARRQLLRQVVDMMLAELDPYEALISGTPSPRETLRVVS